MSSHFRDTTLVLDGEVFCWNPNRGIPRLFRALVPRLCALNPQLKVRILLPGKPAVDIRGLFPGNVEIVSCGVSITAKPWKIWSAVSRLLTNARMNLAWWLSRGDVYISPFYRYSRAPGTLMVMAYDMMPEIFRDQFASRDDRRRSDQKLAAFAKAGHIVCISQATLEDVVRIAGVARSRCSVAVCGADSLLLDAGDSGQAPQQPFVLYVGGVSYPYKNFSGLVESFDDPSFSGFRLVVAGPEAADVPPLTMAATRLGLDRFEYIRGASDAIIQGLYAKCSVFVCPSFYEGFGLPVVEALACGAPVACSRVASLPEAGGECCVYFDPQSIQDMRRAIGQAIDEGRGILLVKKRVTHARTFAWDRMAESVLETICKLNYWTVAKGCWKNDHAS